MPVLPLLIGPVSELLNNVIDRLFPDRDAQAQQRSEMMLKAQQIDAQLAQGQLAINAAEAASNNLFVAGWRPFIGWACGAAFVYHLLLQPLLAFIMASAGHNFPLPSFDTSTLNDVLMGMLGLGTLRSVEKMGASGHLPWQKP